MYIHFRFKNIVYLFPLQYFDLHISFSNLCILAVQSTFESDCALASALPGNETRQSHDPHMAYLIGPHATHDELPDDQKRVAVIILLQTGPSVTRGGSFCKPTCGFIGCFPLILSLCPQVSFLAFTAVFVSSLSLTASLVLSFAAVDVCNSG